MYNPYLNQYKRNAVMTASPEQILIMLYDGAINFLLRAKVAIDEKQVEDAHKNITKTEKIIEELMNSLDMEIGGEMAENLHRLYEYLHYRLIQANIKKNVEMIDEVLGHLRSLKETWEQAIKAASKERKMFDQADDDDEEEHENIDRSV